MRRYILGLGFVVTAGAACGVPARCPPVVAVATAAPLASDYARDFDQFAKEIAEGYAYFGDHHVDWEGVCQRLAPRARQVRDRGAFIALLETALDELHDAHAGLGTNTAHSFRLVPTGADLWADFVGNRAVVTAVRPHSAAARAGVRAGQELLAIGGIPITRALADRLGSNASVDTAARGWALRSLLAGRHDTRRQLTIATADGSHDVVIADPPRAPHAAAAPLTAQRLSAQVGYIRINNSLGDDSLVPAFDAALADLASCPALLLDLRDTPSGGNTAVAEAVMGRFVHEAQLYQRYELPNAGYQGRSRLWAQYVTPRGPFPYQGKLIVLVDHWTGSMGEGMAIGLDGMRRGVVVGTAMAGLNGAVYSQTLPKSGIRFFYPAERLFHLNGTPRHLWLPPVRVELTGKETPEQDVILDHARKLVDVPPG